MQGRPDGIILADFIIKNSFGAQQGSRASPRKRARHANRLPNLQNL
jgi:hypothetical protein